MRCRSALTASLAAWIGILVGVGSVAAGQAPRPSPADASVLRKGSVELGVLGGAAPSSSWLRARRDRANMAAVNIGRVVTGRVGTGAFSGQFELLLEVTPVMNLWSPGHAFGAAVSPVFLRWNFLGSAHLKPFVEVNGGLVVTDQEVPLGTTRINFLDQGGGGVRVTIGARRAVLLGYRFQHLSNGGRLRVNPGANFNFFYGGLAFQR